jgi:hypothetical protein
MVLRLCLKDKSSILIDGDMEDINNQATNTQFIKVINHKTEKLELYNRDHVWCIRESSQE